MTDFCWWHRKRPAVATLRYQNRERGVCSSCNEQILRILNALDAQVLDALIEESREFVRDFITAADDYDRKDD